VQRSRFFLGFHVQKLTETSRPPTAALTPTSAKTITTQDQYQRVSRAVRPLVEKLRDDLSYITVLAGQRSRVPVPTRFTPNSDVVEYRKHCVQTEDAIGKRNVRLRTLCSKTLADFRCVVVSFVVQVRAAVGDLGREAPCPGAGAKATSVKVHASQGARTAWSCMRTKPKPRLGAGMVEYVHDALLDVRSANSLAESVLLRLPSALYAQRAGKRFSRRTDKQAILNAVAIVKGVKTLYMTDSFRMHGRYR